MADEDRNKDDASNIDSETFNNIMHELAQSITGDAYEMATNSEEYQFHPIYWYLAI